MKSVQLLILGVCAIALPSCVAPQPVVISQPATPDYSTPTYKKPAPYCPPTYKKKAPYCPPGMSSNSSSRNNSRGAVVDGVFVRDTRPEDVEPARTIGVEVDQ